MCGRLKIIYFCFVEDLFIFIRGDVFFFIGVVIIFNNFVEMFGLYVNISKLCFYFVGVYENVRS